MRYRVRLSVLEPPGVNGTPTPSIPGLVLSGRTDELVPVRVTTGPGDRDGEASYEIVHAGTGRFVEGGVGDSAWVQRFAGSSKLRRMQFVAESSLTLPQVRAALNLGRPQIETGGRTWLGASAADNPASSLGWWLFGFALAGAAYYANQQSRGGLSGDMPDVERPEDYEFGPAAYWARVMAALRARKPRPLHKIYGQNPTEQQRMAWESSMRDWNRQYRAATANWKKASAR